MKLRVLSDTHVDTLPNNDDSIEFVIEKINNLIPTCNSCSEEILVLPGDLGIVSDMEMNFNARYEKLLYYFKSRWTYIVIVPGNTEYHGFVSGETLPGTDSVLKTKCEEMGIVYLQKGVAKIDDLFFVGCTMWTYPTQEEWKTTNKIDKKIFKTLNMYRTLHVEHLEWLNDILNELANQNEKAVVITHYPPQTNTTKPVFKVSTGEKVEVITESGEVVVSETKNVSYIDNFIMKHADTIKLWICGHIHDKHHMEKCGVKIYVNSMGEYDEVGKHRMESGLIEI